MKAIKTMVMLLGLTSWAISGYAATSLPFETNFNGLVVGTDLVKGNAWEYGVTAPKVVNGTPDNEAIYAADGVTLNISGSNSKVWWFSYAKVRAHSTVPSIGPDAAAFYVNDQAQLMAYDQAFNANAGGFTNVASGVLTNSWVKFAVRLDYSSGAWDLYMANPYTAELTKRNDSPLKLQTGYAAAIRAAEVSGETYLDDISVEATVQSVDPVQESPGNVGTVPLIVAGNASAVDVTYFGGSGDLNEEFGGLLATMFSNGDRLLFWNGTGFDIVTLVNGNWDVDVAFMIYPTTGCFIQRSGSANSALVAYNTPVSYTNNPPTIAGGGAWNLLAMPNAASSRTLSNSGIPAGLNDQVFLRTSSGWSISTYKSTGWTPNLTIPSGGVFWLFRREATNPEWIVP